MNIFILNAGLGYGNASRQTALCELTLNEHPKCNIFIFSWGKGLEFYAQNKLKSRVKYIKLFSYTNNKYPYLIKMLLALIGSPIIYLLNSFKILSYIIEKKPKTAIFDSDYHFLVFLPFRTKRIAINQALYILEATKRYKNKLTYDYTFSYIIEYLDCYIQKLFCHYLFVPSFENLKTTKSTVISIPLLVRKKFKQQSPKTNSKEIAAILSGSQIERERIEKWAKKNKLSVWPCSRKKQNIINTPLQHTNYSYIFIQAGQSSIAECLQLQKNFAVLPIKGHWEQLINALELKRIHGIDYFLHLPQTNKLKKIIHRSHRSKKQFFEDSSLSDNLKFLVKLIGQERISSKATFLVFHKLRKRFVFRKI